VFDCHFLDFLFIRVINNETENCCSVRKIGCFEELGVETNSVVGLLEDLCGTNQRMNEKKDLECYRKTKTK
jgi:hypothetical protein